MPLPPPIEPPFIDDRIQSLPQELQEMILDHLVYQAVPLVHVTRDYKPPIGLQLNKKIRAKSAKYYYGPTVKFHVTGNRNDSVQNCVAWLRSLETVYRDKMRIIMCGQNPSKPHWCLSVHNKEATIPDKALLMFLSGSSLFYANLVRGNAYMNFECAITQANVV